MMTIYCWSLQAWSELRDTSVIENKDNQAEERGGFRSLLAKRLSCLVLTLSLLTGSLLALPQSAEANSRYAAIVIDGETGKVLFARNADKPRYPASLTKIMRAYATFQAIKLGDLTLQSKLISTETAAKEPPSKIGLPIGAEISM